MPSSGDKGLELEEVLKAYFWQAGFFVLRGAPYRLDSEDVTDIDLWLYERPGALTRRRIIVDVKNRRSPKAAERIVWTKGLQAALGADGAIVTTTDKRTSARRLSKALNVTLIDGDAVNKLMHSEQLRYTGCISSTELDILAARVDKSRRSTDWSQNLRSARASIISGIGVQSTNKNLAANAYFAEQTVQAQPGSEQAQVGLRLVYLTAALAAISLDYMVADQAFRPQEERRQAIVEGIRFGESESVGALSTVRVAISLARKYTDSGTAAAKQIEHGFYGDADRIPAEIIADYVARISTSDVLFNVARELERASSEIELTPYDQMTAEAKSLLGVFLDFNGVSREKIAQAWSPAHRTSTSSKKPPSDRGLLFEELGKSAAPHVPADKNPRKT